VFFLTTFPIYSELWTGKGITMGPPIYNRVVLPWFLVLLFLVGIGPMMAWRKASAASMRRHFFVPLIVTAVITLALAAAGVREFYPLAFYAAAGFILSTHISEFYRGTRARMVLSSESAHVALGRLIWRNRRRYGGYIVHLGIVSLVIGIVGSSAYKKDHTFEDVKPGTVMRADGYEVRYERIDMVQEPGFTRATLTSRLSRGGRDLGPLVVEKRIYKDVKNPTTEVAIHSILLPRSFADLRRLGEDVYLTPISMDPETGLASFSLHILPFVNWLWLGGIIMLIGTHIAILPDKREARLMAVSKAVEERAVA